jgi:hypothetical protein
MPLLDPADIIHMLDTPPIVCPECKRPTYQNYCRECDEFYHVGHANDCAQHGEHSGHRIYPVLPVTPFKTDPSKWAVFLDPLREKHVWIEHEAIKRMFGETFASQAYVYTFLEMGDRALAWAEKATLRDGQVHPMHFDGHDLDLRIGVVGGQLMVFMPRAEIEDATTNSAT